MSRPYSTLSSPRAYRSGLWPVALLCALAYLGAVAHFTLVQHATCAAHGELLHATEAPSEAVAVERFADARVAAPTQAVDADHDAEAHCTSGLTRRELSALDPLRERPGCSGAVATLVRAGPAPAEQVARLHLAPKGSPPGA